MYNSIKNWLNIPAQIRPFTKRTGAGTKQFGDIQHVSCYIAGEATVVKNTEGEEVVSNTQVYLDGSQEIYVMDRLIVAGTECDIKSIATFYREGRPDLKVVYL